jgi:hypothetical protein
MTDSYAPLSLRQPLEVDLEHPPPTEAGSTPNPLSTLRSAWAPKLLAAVGLAGTLAVWGLVPSSAAPATQLAATVSFAESGTRKDDETIKCHSGTQDWDPYSVALTEAEVAVKKAFMLTEAERDTECEPAMPPFPFEAEDFLLGSEHRHHAYVEHKYSSDCSHETFKLHFFVGSEEDGTHWTQQVTHDLDTDAWKLIASNPNACAIQVGSASAPEQADVTSKPVDDAAKFAMAELQNFVRECHGEGTTIELAKIKSAVTSVLAGVKIDLVLAIEVTDESEESYSSEPEKVDVQCSVFNRCGGAGECVKQLMFPKAAAADGEDPSDTLGCSVLMAAVSEAQSYPEGKPGLGHIVPDATELYVSTRRLLLYTPSELYQSGDGKPPIQPREIPAKSGIVIPDAYDPRDHECMQKITVYNQGSCGSCYANAVNAMIGIRKCFQDKGMPSTSRRLEQKLPELEELRAAAEKVETQSLDTTSLAECADSTTWSAFGAGDYKCTFFAEQDPGCTKYTDYGQRTHCKKTCGKCPPTAAEIEANKKSNPWNGAWYEYMPSVSDTASCANYNGRIQGCDGGNPHGVWTPMMKDPRDLWRMGEKCLPYNMKCVSSTGVTNPLAGGACSKYTGYETWHKPCSCIPGNKRPSGTPTCPSAPSSGCGTPAPEAMFTIKGVGQGLSISAAVENMQRHILEYGPIYVGFSTTSDFMNWYQKHDKKSTYTGGGHKEGGHAVIIVGWGADSTGDYWIIRNSWGADWADGGHAKFSRGRNLDQIEEMGMSASMPVKDYKDWSPPSCSIVSWGRSWMSDGSMYDVFYTVRCSKKAHVKGFFSVKLTDRDQIRSGVSGTAKEFDCEAQQPCTVPDIHLVHLDFGKSDGDQWIQLTADDGKGNSQKSSQFINLPKVF